jgi:hypothetical protein
MKPAIDDLPVVRASALLAHGYISRGAVTVLVRFGDDGVECEVGVRMRQFQTAASGRGSHARGPAGAPSGFGCWTANPSVASASARAG